MKNLEIREMTKAERKYSYAQDKDISAKSGYIGYLRGDFGKSGKQFHFTWFENNEKLKTAVLKTEFDELINYLRSDGGILESRETMLRWYKASTESYHSEPENINFFFRVDTESYSYFIRFSRAENDYDFSVFAYVKKMLDENIEQEKQNKEF